MVRLDPPRCPRGSRCCGLSSQQEPHSDLAILCAVATAQRTRRGTLGGTSCSSFHSPMHACICLAQERREVSEPQAGQLLHHSRAGEDPLLLSVLMLSYPICSGRGCCPAFLAGFHIACMNQPGFLLDRRIGAQCHQIYPHGTHTALALGRPTLTPGWIGPQVMPDSQDMLAGD